MGIESEHLTYDFDNKLNSLFSSLNFDSVVRKIEDEVKQFEKNHREIKETVAFTVSARIMEVVTLSEILEEKVGVTDQDRTDGKIILSDEQKTKLRKIIDITENELIPYIEKNPLPTEAYGDLELKNALKENAEAITNDVNSFRGLLIKLKLYTA